MTTLAQPDVLIVGSGAGGGTLARALAERGVKVLVAEAGRRIPREAANRDPKAVISHGRYDAPARWTLNGKDQPQFVSRCVGGHTKFYGAVLMRMRAHDFQAYATGDGVSPAWPIDLADLQEHFGAAERYFQVHGPTDGGVTYPFPAPAWDPYFEEVAQRLRGAGLTPTALPIAVRRASLATGAKCEPCLTCDGFPCHLGAKADAETNGIDVAASTGNCTLLEGWSAEHLQVDGSGMRVREVTLVDSAEEQLRVRPSVVVLAAGAIETPRLLLRSVSHHHPNGLANGSGLVGCRYMSHINTALSVLRAIANPTMFQKQIGVHDYNVPGGATAPFGEIQLRGRLLRQHLVSWWPATAWLPSRLLKEVVGHSLDWWISTEDLPDERNRIWLDRSGDLHAYVRQRNLRSHGALLRRFRSDLRRAGFRGPQVAVRMPLTGVGAGTCVMGTDQTNSVVDSWGRAHQLDNLYIADGSVLVSSASVNFSLTIMALALRTADRILT